MKIICSKYVLNKALNTAYKAITNRTTIPILKGILIETVSENRIRITSTDSEISIEKECECVVEESGSTVINSKLLTEMVKKLPDDDIYIESNNNTVSIKCNTYSSDIASFPADEFPKISEINEIEKIILNKDTFIRMVRKTAFAASTDDSRGILTGVLMELNEGLISMIALDGFRMAIAKETTETDKNTSIVISARLLNEITKIMSDENEESDFSMTIDNKKVVFSIGTTKITSRLLEGDYMNYNDIIPKINKCSIKVRRKDMANVIERASLIVKEGQNNLIKLTIDNSSASISSRSEEGRIYEEFPVETQGEGIEIGFNSKYVLDVLKVIDDENIIMEFNTNITPCLVKPEEGNAFEYLILPVRIN